MLTTLQILSLAVLLTLLNYINAQDHSKDICNAYGGYPTPLSIPSAGLQITNSTDCVKVFQIDLTDPSFANQYLLIQITVQPNTADSNFINYQPYLIGKFGSTPGIDNNDTPPYQTAYSNAPDHYDVSGWMNRKTFHYISLTPQQTSSSGIYYLAFYRYFTDGSNYYSGPIYYSVSISASPTYQCSRGCSNQGTCDTANQKCNCNKGFFDNDCSIQATPITRYESYQSRLNPFTSTYFYLSTSAFTIDGELDFGCNVDVYYQRNQQGVFSLPGLTSSGLKWYYWPASQFCAAEGVTIQSSDTNNEVGQNIIVRMFNPDPKNTKNLSYSMTQNDDTASGSNTSLFAIIFPTIAATFFIITIIFCCISLVKRRRARQLLLNRRVTLPSRWNVSAIETANLNASSAQLINPNPLPQTIAAIPQLSGNDLLSKAQIDQFFPKINFEFIQDKFHNSCSICLEDFIADASCRELYCKHVFHDICIEEWLAKHNKCPNCNQIMTVEEIGNYLKEVEIFAHFESKVQNHATIVIINQHAEDTQDQT